MSSAKELARVPGVQGWGDYRTKVIDYNYLKKYDYDYIHSECNRLQLYCKVIMITIMITMYITQTECDSLLLFTKLHL